MYHSVKKILYATDLSDPAKEALKYAMDIAFHHKASMTAIHVIPDVFEELSLTTGVEMEMYFGFDKWKDMEKSYFERAKKAVQERIVEVCEFMKPHVPDLDCNDYDFVIKAGHPVKEILKYAEEKEFDLIVMATHGYGHLEELIMGSVSRGVMKKSHIPVFLVPIKRKK